MLLLQSVISGFLPLVVGGWSSAGQVLPVYKDSSPSGGTVLGQSVAPSSIGCVILCKSHVQCATVSFHRHSKSCVIYADYLVDQTVSYQPGWVLIGVKVSVDIFCMSTDAHRSVMLVIGINIDISVELFLINFYLLQAWYRPIQPHHWCIVFCS